MRYGRLEGCEILVSSVSQRQFQLLDSRFHRIRERDEWSGSFVVVGEPAEEGGPAIDSPREGSAGQYEEPGRRLGRAIQAGTCNAGMPRIQTVSSGKKTRPKMARGRTATKNGTTSRFNHSSAREDEAESILFSDCYQPFGQDNAATGSETYRYTGKPVSAKTGLYYYL